MTWRRGLRLAFKWSNSDARLDARVLLSGFAFNSVIVMGQYPSVSFTDAEHASPGDHAAIPLVGTLTQQIPIFIPPPLNLSSPPLGASPLHFRQVDASLSESGDPNGNLSSQRTYGVDSSLPSSSALAIFPVIRLSGDVPVTTLNVSSFVGGSAGLDASRSVVLAMSYQPHGHMHPSAETIHPSYQNSSNSADTASTDAAAVSLEPVAPQALPSRSYSGSNSSIRPFLSRAAYGQVVFSDPGGGGQTSSAVGVANVAASTGNGALAGLVAPGSALVSSLLPATAVTASPLLHLGSMSVGRILAMPSQNSPMFTDGGMSAVSTGSRDGVASAVVEIDVTKGEGVTEVTVESFIPQVTDPTAFEPPAPITADLSFSMAPLDSAAWKEAVDRLFVGVENLLGTLSDTTPHPVYLPWVVGAALTLVSSEIARQTRKRSTFSMALVNGSLVDSLRRRRR